MGAYAAPEHSDRRERAVDTKQVLSEEMYKLEAPQRAERAFAALLDGRDERKALEDISSFLKDEFNMEAKVSVLETYSRSYLFGMRIFPSKEELENIALQIVKSGGKVSFVACRSIVIEIDSKLLDKEQVDMTPREMVSILLHEVGHKVYSPEAQRHAGRYYNSNIVATGAAILSASLMPWLASLVVIFLLFSYGSASHDVMRARVEEDADSLAARYGYGLDMESALHKISVMGRGRPSQTTPAADDGFIARVSAWFIDGMKQLSLRRHHILEVLREEARQTDSDFEREMLQSQIRKLEEKLGA